MNLPCAFKKRPGSLHFTLLTYDIPIVKKYNKFIVFFRNINSMDPRKVNYFIQIHSISVFQAGLGQ